MTCRPRSSSRVTPLNTYDYRAVHDSLRGIIRLSNSANVWRVRTCGRLSAENTLLQRLAQHLQDMAAARRQLIQEQHAGVCQRHLTRPWHLAPRSAPPPRWCDAGRDTGASSPRRCGRRCTRPCCSPSCARPTHGSSLAYSWHTPVLISNVACLRVSGRV
jgi:hypothetical protein